MTKTAAQSLTLFASILAVITAALLLYYPVLQFEYIWDDNLIRSDYGFYTLDNWFDEAFYKPFFDYYYRPLPIYTMIVETQLAGRENAASLGHLFNLLLFMASAILVVVISTAATRRSFPASPLWLPLLAGLLLVCHPVVAVGPAWVSARFDVSVTFFALLLLWSNLVIPHPTYRATATGVLFFMASLCKEMSFAIACVIPFWHLFLAGKRWNGWRNYWHWIVSHGHLRSYVAIIIAGVAYLFARTLVLGHIMLPTADKTILLFSLSHLLYVGKTFLWYVQLVFWPFSNIAPAYFQTTPINHNDIFAIAGTILMISVLLAGILLHNKPRWQWACLAFLTSLLPIMNIAPVPAIDNIVELHSAYLPVSFCIILSTIGIAVLTSSIYQYWLKLLAPLALCWIILGIANIRITLPLWRNDVTFWYWYTSVSPQSQAGFKNYSYALMQNGQYVAAEHYADLAINSGLPGADGSLLVRGISRIRTGQLASGIHDLQQFLLTKTSPELTARAKSYMAEGFIALGQLPQAKSLLNEAIILDPDNLHNYLQLVNHATLTNDAAELQQAMNSILRILGNNTETIRHALRESNLDDTQVTAIMLNTIENNNIQH